MKKLNLNTTAILKYFKWHNLMKEELLSKISETTYDDVNITSEYYSDQHMSDWSRSLDFDREWVKCIMPRLGEHFDTCANDLNYQVCYTKEIWFQQYNKNNTHGWHIHGRTYTGVYYLEFPDGSPKTELIDQGDTNQKIVVDAKEGDIIIFPSFIIHRAPKVTNDNRKTIISFNLEFDMINEKLLKSLQHKYDVNIREEN